MNTIALKNPGFVSARMRLREYAARALARLRMQEAINSTFVVLCISLCTLAVFIFADRLFSLSKFGVPVWIIWGGITALGIPYVLWRTYSPRIHENLAAVMADDRLGLNARICTALTLDLDDPANEAFSEAFFSEALGRLNALNVEQAFPIRFPKAMVFLLLPIAACAGMLQFMEYQDRLGLEAAREQKRKAEVIRQKAAATLEGKLEDLKRQLQDQSDEKGGQYKVQQLITQADKVAKELKNGERSPDEAVVALGQLKREIQDEKEKLTQGKEFLERLEKLSAKDLNLDEQDMTKAVSEALKMGDPGLAARQLRKLAQEIKKDILDNPNKTDEQKKEQLDKLKREVEKLAGALAEDEALRENLEELSEKMMDASDFQKLQDEIKKQMEKQGKGNKQHGNELEKQLEEVAEELERLEEDNDAALNEEEEEAMDKLDQVEEGIEEAMEGIINENGEPNGEKQQGKQAAGGKPGQDQKGQQGKQGGANKGGRSMQGRAGKKRGGAQDGGQSGKQAGNNGDNKDNQKGQQQGQPGQGLGGGIGQGKRPQGEIADPGFKAEKVKGKLQNGAITGLSHFRGQGAKGDAPVEFVQALQAAEQESSSSLELERIPNDARDVVKDYFLKVKQGANMAPPPSPAPAQPEKAAPAPAAPKGPEKETLKE